MDKTPVTVFSGFLGSGKTTIISSLIDALQAHKQQIVYIKNEIGVENIDAKLFEGKHIQTRELLNGCICCTLTGPFIHAIEEIVTTLHPDRIIIEASGVADPSAIALMISADPTLLRDGVITVIDVVNFEGYKDLSYAAREQAKFTDLIVFNKVELVPIERKVAVVGYVRELNDFAPIIEAPHGIVSVDLVCGIGTKRLVALMETEIDITHHDHLKEDAIQTIRIPLNKPIHLQKLVQILQHLPVQVFRVKGFVHTSDNEDMIINKVGLRVTTEPLHLSVEELKQVSPCLVCIGFALHELEQQISQQIKNVYC